jgi:hypothetical protein
MSKSKRSLIGAVEFPERSWKNRDTTKDATKVMTKVTTKVMPNAPFVQWHKNAQKVPLIEIVWKSGECSLNTHPISILNIA